MKFIDFVQYIVLIGTYSIIIPIVLGLYYYRHLDKLMKFFLYGLILIFVLDGVMLMVDGRIRNAFHYLFTLLDIGILTLILLTSGWGKRVTKPIYILASIVAVFVIIDAFFLSGLAVNGISNPLAKLYLSGLSIFILSNLITQDLETNLLHQPLLWICLGSLVYNLIGFFDIFAMQILNFSQNLYLQYYIIWAAMTIVMYLLYAKAYSINGSKLHE